MAGSDIVVSAGQATAGGASAKLGEPEEADQDEEDDEAPIGLEIWPSARALLEWLSQRTITGAPDLSGKTLLELGAGTGFLAMEVSEPAGAVGAHKVYATEGEPQVFANMQRLVRSRGAEGRVHTVRWNWEETAVVPADIPLEDVDLVLGSDLVYVGTAEDELADALAELLRSCRARPGLRALLMLCDRAPGGEQFLPNPRPDSGTRAVDRFLTACEARRLRPQELPLPGDLEVPGLSRLHERLNPRAEEPLRLFEVTASIDRHAAEARAE